MNSNETPLGQYKVLTAFYMQKYITVKNEAIKNIPFTATSKY